MIGDETVSAGRVVKLGGWQTLTLNFSYAGLFSGENYKGYQAGDMVSVTLSPAYEPPGRIVEETSRVSVLRDEYNATGNVTVYDDMVGQMLYSTGVAYYAACDRTADLAGGSSSPRSTCL
jgi:hypothetical protein